VSAELEMKPFDRVAASEFAERIVNCHLRSDRTVADAFPASYTGDRGPRLSQLDDLAIARLAQRCIELQAALVRAIDLAETKLDDEVGAVINAGGFHSQGNQPERATLDELRAIAEPQP
jgi:hypothetical protein